MRGVPCRLTATFDKARLCAVLCMVIGLGAGVRAQTQATVLPLGIPSAIVFDAQGNLYFAEMGNHVVRRFSVAGVITTVAGTGVQGFAGDDGPAISAVLDSPAGLAMDAAGNLYIADSHNHRVREVAVATGVIATIAGMGVAGFSGDGGLAKAARFDLPTALAVDAAGNVYVADTDNHRVRRITLATGVITTIAGNGVEGFAGDNGLATAASVDSPNGLAVDGAGNLYVADTHNGRVREVTAATRLISTVAGVGYMGGGSQAFGGDGGAAKAAGLALPRGLTMDSAGNIYVADSANHRIRRISTSGTITTVAGQGTETFAGDEAPAVAASLNTPLAGAISPAGLVTLADSGNHRVRQIDALAAPGPNIHTIAGLDITAPGTLSLSGPSVIAYGSGTVTATLSTATLATGNITFLDTRSGTAVTMGAAGLGADSASFSTAVLAAGTHSLVAVYAGDSSHGATQSPALAMNVTPLDVIAAASPVSILYGQAVPSFGGTLSGVLLQDAGKVDVVFTTAAAALSPAGLYPIAATLTGSAAGNYTVSASPPVNLSIAQAPSLAALSVSPSNPGVGLPVTLNVAATSTTSGLPTGSITLLDGGTVLSVVPLSAAGGAALTTSALVVGTHPLSAVYSGDANFLSSTSAIASIVVGAVSDFTLTATGAASQAVPEGSSATFHFSVATVGAALASPIALTVQGVPVGATASMNPSYLPPGGAVTAFTLTVQTPLAQMDNRARPFAPSHPDSPVSGVLAVLLLPVFGYARRSRFKGYFRGMLALSRRSVSGLLLAGGSGLLLATLATGCANRVNTGSDSASTRTYTLTVTGTATSNAGTAVQHSVDITLQVL
jgi:sugar lactone lactonase YvrE